MSAPAHLAQLTLTDFRNYGQLSATFDNRHVVLFGANGAGKTNLIEAVSLLSPGRGLRRAQLSDMARKGTTGGFTVFAKLALGDERFAVGTGTQTAPGSAETNSLSRRVRINGTTAKSADELLDLIRVLWLTPAMDGLFTGPASDRRRFLDRMVLAIDPAHAKRARDYEQAMRQRNRLLETVSSNQTEAMLDAIEAQLAALGTAIIAARQELIGLLGGAIDRQGGDHAFPTAIVAISQPQEAPQIDGLSAGDLEATLADDLRTHRYRDRAAGRTLTGPHRADLRVHHQEKDMPAGSCSTGEQKALLTGMVLAHAALTASISGMAPVLLLDEVAAHLDQARRAALFDQIDALGGQAFMTGTDKSLFDALGQRAQYLHVDNGQLTPDD